MRFGVSVLGAVSAIAGFGLYKDIRAMRDQKTALFAGLTKCTKMIELLEKAQ